MGSINVAMSLFVGLIWFISGLIINTLQLILFLTLKPFNRSLFRQLNYYLTYSSWSQIVVLSEYISGSQVRVYYADEETKEMFGKEHCICISNHKFEVDWMFCWMFVDKLRCLGVRFSTCFFSFDTYHDTYNNKYIFRAPKRWPRSRLNTCQSWAGAGTSVRWFSWNETGTRTGWYLDNHWTGSWSTRTPSFYSSFVKVLTINLLIVDTIYRYLISIKVQDGRRKSTRRPWPLPRSAELSTSSITWFQGLEDLLLPSNISNLKETNVRVTIN